MANFLNQLFRMSLWGSLLTVLILLIKQAVGARLPPTFHYAIWGVLILRLIIPFSPSYLRPLAVEESAKPPFTVEAAESLQNHSELSDKVDIPAFSSETALPERTANFGQSLTPELPPDFAGLLRKLLSAGYALGCAVYAGVMLLTLIHYRKELLPSEDLPKITALFENERAHIRAPKRTRLRIAVSGSPYASGVLLPCVTIPLALTTDFEEDDLRAVFRHELTHIRYGDTVLRVFLVVLQCLYWFNPILWYAFACIRRDGEYACDMRVLCRSGAAERVSYGKAIVNVAELYMCKTNQLYSGFAMQPLRQRIQRILTYQPVRLWMRLAAAPLILVCLLAGTVIGTRVIEVLTMDATKLTATEIRRWGSVEYPLLAEIPEKDMALYAVDASLLYNGPYSDRSYDGRVVLRQGERTQIFDWGKIYAESNYPVMAAGDYNGDGRTEYICIRFGDFSFGEFLESLRVIRETITGYWDDSVVLEGADAVEVVAKQFTAGEIVNGALTFTLNNEFYRIELPADLKEKQLLQLKVLPYIRFHSEVKNELSVSVMIGAYFDSYPTFAGYLNAPITFADNTLTVGTATFAGSMFRDYPANWIRLYDEETGITLGLPPHWENHFVNTAPHIVNDKKFCFDLYEKYNFEIPPKYGDGVHFGFILSFYTSELVYEDFYGFLGYRNGVPFDYIYAHGIEFDERDSAAKPHYRALSMDDDEIVRRFVIVNHLSVKRRLDYWNMMI